MKPPPKTLEEWLESYRNQFPRQELFATFQHYVKSLLRGVEAKGKWGLSGSITSAEMRKIQRLLTGSKWSSRPIMGRMQRACFREIGSEEGVFLLGYKKFFKKGDRSVGTIRRFLFARGPSTKNGRQLPRYHQLGVFLGYASGTTHLLVSRGLYLPKSWTNNPKLCEEAGVPKPMKYRSRWRLTRRLLVVARKNGAKGSWVTGARSYAYKGKFLQWLTRQRLFFVFPTGRSSNLGFSFAVEKYDPIEEDGRPSDCFDYSRSIDHFGWGSAAWEPISIRLRDGRVCEDEWATQAVGYPMSKGGQVSYILVARRKKGAPAPSSFYLTNAPPSAPLKRIAEVALLSGSLKHCLQEADKQVDLSKYEVRSWVGWYRMMSLCLIALAWVALQDHRQHTPP